ncbi:hypothetical protein K449DRAFT_171756 [Hypoxylon sp. EC38]|nr:hypothetical protein K449DRAFT_171756 [Hypoxylon sp. EC38]
MYQHGGMLLGSSCSIVASPLAWNWEFRSLGNTKKSSKRLSSSVIESEIWYHCACLCLLFMPFMYIAVTP